MKKKIVFYMTAITLVALAIFFGVSYKVMENMSMQEAERSIKSYAEILAHSDVRDIESLPMLPDELRITIMDLEGNVIYDNQIHDEPQENHLYREEVRAALAGIPHTVKRRSKTLNTDLLYYAMKLESNESSDGKQYIFRTSLPIYNINKYLYRAVPLFAAIFIVIVISAAIMASSITDKILRPLKIVRSSLQSINATGKEPEVVAPASDDVAQMLTYISDISRKLKENIKKTTDERNKSEKLRSEFFDNASHELKTPLTSIVGFNELLMLNNKDENLDRYIQQIDREAKRMMTLITDMLHLSKLENTMRTDNIELSLGKITGEVINSLEPDIREHNVTATINGDVTVHGEYMHMYELIKNIVENAIKYNVPNGIVTITMGKNNDDVGYIQVSDTGIGIADKHLARIFERFYRVEKSRSRATGGTGLGLAIVKHICELYNATIDISSEIDKGTTITVKFA